MEAGARCRNGHASMPAGWQYVDLTLEKGEKIITSTADLSQFFDTCKVSAERAQRNRVGPPRPLASFDSLRPCESDVAPDGSTQRVMHGDRLQDHVRDRPRLRHLFADEPPAVSSVARTSAVGPGCSSFRARCSR